jgi:pyridoxamine 5'-phosphate oxidase
MSEPYRGLLRRTDLDPDPLAQFDAWFAGAREAVPLAEAMALATVSADGRPAVRYVLMKGHGPRGFEFHTDYRSPKAADLDANPRAAAVFWWPQLGRQVRISGPVERLDAASSDSYFETRPRERRLGAWASEQSRPLAGRAELEARLGEVESRFEGREIERPEHWGGYRLVPEELEFWQQGEERLHDRFRYRRAGEGWEIGRLAP